MATEPKTSLPHFLGRLAWMLLGPMGLMIAALAIARGDGGWFGAADVVFWLLVGLMLVGRLQEFRGGKPLTADGEPADAGHLRRYLIAAPLAAGALWLAAHGFGFWIRG